MLDLLIDKSASYIIKKSPCPPVWAFYLIFHVSRLIANQ